jgi:hypothetical protein
MSWATQGFVYQTSRILQTLHVVLLAVDSQVQQEELQITSLVMAKLELQSWCVFCSDLHC